MLLRPMESSFLTGSTCSLQDSPKVHVSLMMVTMLLICEGAARSLHLAVSWRGLCGTSEMARPHSLEVEGLATCICAELCPCCVHAA